MCKEIHAHLQIDVKKGWFKEGMITHKESARQLRPSTAKKLSNQRKINLPENVIDFSPRYLYR